MSKLTVCKRGDKVTCGDDTTTPKCCYFMKVLEEKKSPSAMEKGFIASWATMGIPTTNGMEAYVCMTGSIIKNNKDAANQVWTSTETGIKYNGYCAGAVALKAVTALTAMMAITAY